MSQTKVTGGTSTSTSYSYDDAGNRTARTTPGNSVTFAWDPEGELAAVDEHANTYDASGNRIVRSDDSGTTIYLPGGQEIHINGQTVTASRFYSFAGTTVATRASGGRGAGTSLVCGHQGSVVATVPNTEWTPTSVTRIQLIHSGATRANSGYEGAPGDHRFRKAPYETPRQD